jgi:hypothetical protein
MCPFVVFHAIFDPTRNLESHGICILNNPAVPLFQRFRIVKIARPLKASSQSLGIEQRECSHQSARVLKFECCVTSIVSKCSKALDRLRKGASQTKMVAGLYWAIAQCTSVLMRPASKLKIICCEDLVLYKDPVNSLHLFFTCALHVPTN